MKFISHQFGSARANQNIDAINPGETFEARCEIDCVANHRWVHSLVRANIADDYFALIDADPHAQSHAALVTPFLIELSEFSPHLQRRAYTIFGVLCNTKTAHIPPYRHDRVTNEFIECTAITENDGSHLREMLIELRD